MGDLASDHDAAIELVIEEYRRLHTHDSKHELLQYITNVRDNGFKHVKSKEFFDRFETPEDKKLDYIKMARVLCSYYVALREAVDKIEGINRSPKSKEKNIEPIKTLEEDLEDLPF